MNTHIYLTRSKTPKNNIKETIEILYSKPIVWYDESHRYHIGDNSHPEHPRRIDGILQYIKPLDLSGKLFLKKLDEDVSTIHGLWKYASDDNNDTTYFTEYTKMILARVRTMIDYAYFNINSGCKCVFILSRPPGHHFSSDKGSHGFCLQNNIWYATLQSFAHGFKKPLILDWDVHHGDGTEREVLNSNVSCVRLISMHVFGKDIYPETGNMTYLQHPNNKNIDVVNVPLRRGSTNTEYIIAFYQHVLTRIIEYSPDIILVSAGFDGHKNDPMKLMKLDERVYYEMSQQLKLRNCPVMFILEGGYCPKTLGKCVNETLRIWTEEIKSSI